MYRLTALKYSSQDLEELCLTIRSDDLSTGVGVGQGYQVYDLLWDAIGQKDFHECVPIHGVKGLPEVDEDHDSREVLCSGSL